MKKIKNFFKYFNAAMAFNQLPEVERQITFYSEGKNYWSYLEGLLLETLEQSDLTICYITSSIDDPVFEVKNDRIKTFLIDEGFVRDWLFANIDTKVFVMTMPDINQYQVKRSKFPVHYVYTQHSLVSFHMVYRPGAFDYYDTILCSGPHHLTEMRALEALYNLPEKNLVKHGYSRLDSILKEAEARPASEETEEIHYLLAPSWGPEGTIESGLGIRIVSLILDAGHKITFRPHPMTTKLASLEVEKIVEKFSGYKNFAFEDNVRGQDSLHESDVMICDWSGAALDYSFGLGKPVIFIDVPRKVNNPNYMDLQIEPFEVLIREEIGTIILPDNLEEILKFKIDKLPSGLLTKHIFNPRQSNKVGAKELLKLL